MSTYQDEITSYFEEMDQRYLYLVMGDHRWGLGSDLTEACYNAFGNGSDPDDAEAVAEWDRPVKAVVDQFGRVHWDDAEANLTWLREPA